jgi:hypothetical protein
MAPDDDRITEIADRLHELSDSLTGEERQAAFEAATADMTPEEHSAVMSLVQQRLARRLEHAEANEVEIDFMEGVLERTEREDLAVVFKRGLIELQDWRASHDPESLRIGIARLLRDAPDQIEDALFTAVLMDADQDVSPALANACRQWFGSIEWVKQDDPEKGA